MIPDPKQAIDSERAVGWLLAAVLILGFGVRLWMAWVLPVYFDDRYIFNNVLTFLNGSLRPRHSYYGSLSYLPQALVLGLYDSLRSSAGFDAIAVRGTYVGGFTLGAFRVMRIFIIVYAMASILITYRVGRALFSPTAGLAAAAVLAAYPQHLRSSVQLKPDMMVLMLALVTLSWTERASRVPRLSRFLLAGVGVGLATSAKYIGAASALPLTVWAIWSGFHDRRRWAWLLLSGLTSVATFFALNPFVTTVFHFGSRLVWFYGKRARGEHSGRLVVLREELQFLASQHGWLLLTFLLLGTVLLVGHLWRKSASAQAAMLALSLAVGYPALYALVMTLFRTHNLLPALGGTALVCAYGMASSISWLMQRRAFARTPMGVFLIWLVPSCLLMVPPLTYTYHRVIPDTWDATETALRARLSPLRNRQVAYEATGVRLGLQDGWRLAHQTRVPSLASLSPSLLDLTDAEVFPLSRRALHEPFFEDRLRRLAPECVLEILPRPFQQRGTPLVVVLHPWTPSGDPIPMAVERAGDSAGELVARLPNDLATDEILSLELVRPLEESTATTIVVQPGGQRIPLEYAGHRLERVRLLTSRFRCPTGAIEIRIPVSARAVPTRFQLKLWRWTPSEACLPRAKTSSFATYDRPWPTRLSKH